MTANDFYEMEKYGIDSRPSLIEALSSYYAEFNTSMNAVAKKLGKSQSYLSQYMSGKLEVTEDSLRKMDATVANFLKREYERRDLDANQYVPLQISETIQDTLQTSYNAREMGFIYGYPGTGKTMAATEYLKHNPLALLITAYHGIRPKAILVRIARALEVETKGNEENLLHVISRALIKGDRLLIIDEAQFLNTRGMELIRHIYDLTKCSIVYMAQPYKYREMTGIGLEEYGQLTRRIGVTNELPHPSNVKKGSEMDKIYRNDIIKLAKARGIDDEEIHDYLYQIACEKWGSLGTVSKVLDRAKDKARVDKTEITTTTIAFCRNMAMSA